MITISEGTPKKASGVTTLFVSFGGYNPRYVEMVKGCSGAVYDGNTKEWEVPVIYLAHLLDSLCVYDSINLSLLEEEDEPEQAPLNLPEYKITPYKYQYDGIKYGLTHDKWLLLDAPGLGKTLQTLHIAEELKAQGKIEHCLIVCGMNSLKANWVKEIKKHTDQTYRVLGERITSNGTKTQMSADKRIQQLKEPISEFFLITGIGSLRNEKFVAALNDGPNKIDMILMDEAHKCKDQRSQQGSGLLKLTKARYKISMTGTLILNNPLDTYVALKWIGAEKSTFTTFRNTYCEMYNDFPVGYKNMDLLKHIIDKYSLRRTKDLLDLPPMSVQREYVTMCDDQMTLYETVKQGIKAEIVDKVKLHKNNLLSMVTRLREVTACPSMITTMRFPSAKVDRACDLAEQIVSGSGKVVIFSTFMETVRMLADQLKSYHPLLATGELSDDEVARNTTRFQNDPEPKILIGTWQRIGTGLDLYSASEAIFIDTPWTKAVFDQCCDRLHRIGATNPVIIHNLIAEGTIDERCAEILDIKGAVGDYIIDDIVTDDGLEILRRYIMEL